VRPCGRASATTGGGAVIVLLLCCAAAAKAFTCEAGQDEACAALGALYEATDGGNWARNDGWRDAAADVATSCCSFFNVECDGDGVVLGLCATKALPALCAAHDARRRHAFRPGSLAPASFIVLRRRARLRRRWHCSDSDLRYNLLSGSIPSAFWQNKA
jgi:hypothetical protein